MKISLTERRQIENEMIFRRMNEKIGKDLDDLDAVFLSENTPHLMWDDTLLLNFQCECSDETCTERIPIRLSVYKKIHENRNAFVIKLNHQVDSIENVILSEEQYSVVQKNNTVPEPGDKLHNTSIKNSKSRR